MSYIYICPECGLEVETSFTIFLHGFYHGAMHERERKERVGVRG